VRDFLCLPIPTSALRLTQPILENGRTSHAKRKIAFSDWPRVYDGARPNDRLSSSAADPNQRAAARHRRTKANDSCAFGYPGCGGPAARARTGKPRHEQVSISVSKEEIDAIIFWATLLALGFNAVALFLTARQLWAGRRGASASSVIALNESFRQSWLLFNRATTEFEKQYAFSDVMNLIEIACAIFEDKLFVGKSGKLLEDYLCHVFILIQETDDFRNRLEKMFLTPKTFIHALTFLKTHRNQVRGIELPLQSTSTK